MAKKKTAQVPDKLMNQLDNHYQMWTKDNEKRMARKHGWNDITDAYYGKLPDDWPYMSKVVDPRLRTSLIEKNARLLNSKLRGTLVPREGADVVSAAINNAVLDYQWDNANDGGSMNIKMSIADMDTRLYQSKFALIYWKYEVNDNGECVFDGNEMQPLDIRDCGIDPTATHIRDAKWFQLRTWEFIEDLEDETDTGGKSMYKNIGSLKAKVAEKLGNKKSTSKNNAYTPRVKTLQGLEDRTGEDLAFPMVMLVTEYREDRWITFSPEYKLILRDIPNPYNHGKIPVAQLRYYHIQDDPLGESEVESVLSLWLAIQATINAYMDEVILKIRPPLKIIENAARIETIQYGPEAQWLMDRQDAVEEMKSSGDTLAYFQTTYQALVAAFNTAMGDTSQGISNFGPFESGDKTATEIKQSSRQQNTRDQKNQNDLSEFITDIMLMWLSNNRQFLFTDPNKSEHVLKIIGQEQYGLFKRAGMAETELPPEMMQMIADIIEQNPEITPEEIEQMVEMASVPKYPVVTSPKEKDFTKIESKPKLRISDVSDSAELSVVPKDLEGVFDYIPDVRSMSVGSAEEMMQSNEKAIMLFSSNPTVLQLLAQEGYRPNVKELLETSLNGLGHRDSSRFFTKIEDGQTNPNVPQEMGGVTPPVANVGVPNVPQANIAGGIPEQMAGPQPVGL